MCAICRSIHWNNNSLSHWYASARLLDPWQPYARELLLTHVVFNPSVYIWRSSEFRKAVRDKCFTVSRRRQAQQHRRYNSPVVFRRKMWSSFKAVTYVFWSSVVPFSIPFLLNFAYQNFILFFSSQQIVGNVMFILQCISVSEIKYLMLNGTVRHCCLM